MPLTAPPTHSVTMPWVCTNRRIADMVEESARDVRAIYGAMERGLRTFAPLAGGSFLRRVTTALSFTAPVSAPASAASPPVGMACIKGGGLLSVAPLLARGVPPAAVDAEADALLPTVAASLKLVLFAGCEPAAAHDSVSVDVCLQHTSGAQGAYALLAPNVGAALQRAARPGAATAAAYNADLLLDVDPAQLLHGVDALLIHGRNEPLVPDVLAVARGDCGGGGSSSEPCRWYVLRVAHGAHAGGHPNKTFAISRDGLARLLQCLAHAEAHASVASRMWQLLHLPPALWGNFRAHVETLGRERMHTALPLGAPVTSLAALVGGAALVRTGSRTPMLQFAAAASPTVVQLAQLLQLPPPERDALFCADADGNPEQLRLVPLLALPQDMNQQLHSAVRGLVRRFEFWPWVCRHARDASAAASAASAAALDAPSAARVSPSDEAWTLCGAAYVAALQQCDLLAEQRAVRVTLESVAAAVRSVVHATTQDNDDPEFTLHTDSGYDADTRLLDSVYHACLSAQA